MNKNQVVKEICKREGKKSQVAIGNVREIVSVIEDIQAEHAFSIGVRTVDPRGGFPFDMAIRPGIQKKLDRLWKKDDAAVKKAGKRK